MRTPKRWRLLACALLVSGCDEEGSERWGPPSEARAGLASCDPEPPVQCGTWDGVELRATAADEPVIDARRLCRAIAFEVPGVVEGSAASGAGRWAELRFVDEALGKPVTCKYRAPAEGAPYEFKSCNHGRKAGDLAHSSSFELEARPGKGAPAVAQLRLGEPDVVGGVTQTQEFTSTDPALAGVLLSVPRGAAPPFETFRLTKRERSEANDHINLGRRDFRTLAPAVVVEPGQSAEEIAFDPAPGCTALTLRLDPGALASLGLTAADARTFEVGRVLPWHFYELGDELAPASLDEAAGTLTLCIQRTYGYLPVVKDPTPITYHGGPVMRGRINVYLIWYGTVDAAERTIITDFLSDLGGSPWMLTGSTYPDGGGHPATADVALAGQVDDSGSHGVNLSYDDVADVIADRLDANDIADDPQGLYVVIGGAGVVAPGMCSKNCGWHTARSLQGIFSNQRYAFIGHPGACGACVPNDWDLKLASGVIEEGPSPNGDRDADAMVSVLAHEIVEAATDPDISAWYGEAPNGEDVENADKCAWQFDPLLPDTAVTSAPSFAACANSAACKTGGVYNGLACKASKCQGCAAHADCAGSPDGRVACRSGRCQLPTANMTLGTHRYLVQENWVNVGGGWGYCGLRVENDAAVVVGFSTDLPQSAAGQASSPMIMGKTYHATITVQNVGDTTWVNDPNDEQYSLGSQSPQDNDFFGTGGRIALAPGVSVAPGQQHTFAFDFTWGLGPFFAELPFRWKMVRETVRWFGDLSPLVVVHPAANSSVLADPTNVPPVGTDGTSAATVSFRNISGVAWRPQDGYRLRVLAPTDATWGVSKVEFALNTEIQPGQVATFAIPLKAPHTAGVYPLRAQLEQDGVGLFGAIAEHAVVVHVVDRAAVLSVNAPAVVRPLGPRPVVVVRFRNVGTTTWTTNYRIERDGGDIPVVTTPLPTIVSPGGEIELAAPLVVPLLDQYPTQASLGLTLSNGLQRFGDGVGPLSVVIDRPVEELARCDSLVVPTTMLAGQSYTASFSFTNVGETLWTTSTHQLRAMPPDLALWGTTHAPLSADVGPGGTTSLNVPFIAPVATGDYTFFWMLARGEDVFFDPCVTNVHVALGFDAAFGGWNLTPNPQGDVFFFPLVGIDVAITMVNNGLSAWNSGSVWLQLIDPPNNQGPNGQTMYNLSRIDLAPGESVAPGAQKQFSFHLTAPGMLSFSPLQWRLETAGGGRFGAPTPFTRLIAKGG